MFNIEGRVFLQGHPEGTMMGQQRLRIVFNYRVHKGFWGWDFDINFLANFREEFPNYFQDELI